CIFTSDNPRSEDPLAILRDMTSDLPPDAPVTLEPDRRAAIALALRSAQPGDLIAILGKGHEDYQEIHGQRTPFSDLHVAQQLLGGLA
ncbi:MAG: UDP-N-acetylmuramoyl-L-alanyl-D-glutamate--2,6-diaminopimelate ligase, partial [Verrucomicrobiia bacterium]